MSNLGSANWSETAASNNAAPPDGWPEGMNPSDVNNSARENMAAIKGFWNRNNVVKTTGGTSTAYTLGYDVAAASYYNGEKFAFIVNATCGAAPTLNINALGAFNIRKFSGGAFTNLVAGDIVANQPLEVYYNSSATTFDIITQQPTTVWQALDSAALVAQASYSKQSISTSINILQITFDLLFSTNNITLNMQFYNSAGTLDAGNNYTFSALVAYTNSTTLPIVGTGGAIPLGQGIANNSVVGCSGDITIPNIQGVKATQCNYRTNWNDQGGTAAGSLFGGGYRGLTGNITGVKIFPTTGTMSGRITVLGSSN